MENIRISQVSKLVYYVSSKGWEVRATVTKTGKFKDWDVRINNDNRDDIITLTKETLREKGIIK